MKRDIERRLEALEQRKGQERCPDGLGYFYALIDAEKKLRTAHLYGGKRNGRS